jgi:hypothetical protein
MDPAPISIHAARHRPRGPVRPRGPLHLVLAGAIVFLASVSVPAASPAAEGGPSDPSALLREVQAQLQAARGAEVAFLTRYPVRGPMEARRYVDDAHAAIGRARAAAARIAALDRGVPHGCCATLDAELARHDAALTELADLAGVKGGPTSGLTGEARRTLEGLDRYLDRLGGAEDVASPPTPRTDAIRSLKDDVAAIRHFEADYRARAASGSLARIGDRVVAQRRFLEDSPLDDRERARVDTHVRTYLIYLERVAVTDVDILRARHDLRRTAAHIAFQVHYYLTGQEPPAFGGRAI